MRTYRPWTTQDTEQLSKLYGSMPRGELARRMSRHPDCLAKKARALGLIEEREPLTAKLQKHLRTNGISVIQLMQLTGTTERAVSRALAKLMTAGQAHRHRHMNADLYYSTAEACASNAARLQAERKAHSRALQQKYARNRYVAKLAAQGLTPSTPKPKPKVRTVGKPAAKQRTRSTTATIDARPGAQQVVTLPGLPAPVQLPPKRGPANLPGDPIIPPGLIIQRGPAGPDHRYTASPQSHGLGLATRRPGDYAPSTKPSAWVSATLARHGA